MSSLEQRARRAWLTNASRVHHGVCDACGRHHDHDGRPVFVARQRGARRFLCLDCWDQTAPARRAA